MSAQNLLNRLQNVHSDDAFDWRAIREEIHDEFDRAVTKEDRELLLNIFKAVMDLVDRQLQDSDDLTIFQETRLKDYRLLVVKECMIGEHVSVEVLDEVTEREVAAGRMAPDDELRITAKDGMAAPHQSKAELVLEACVQHAKTLLTSQLPTVHERHFDFLPRFQDMAIRLYLAGAMCRYGEQFDLPTNAKDRAFVCLMAWLMKTGVSEKKAQKEIQLLNQTSRTPNGDDSRLFLAGYRAVPGDGSLAQLLEGFRNDPQISGAPFRLLDRAKPIAVILAVATFLLALVIGRSYWEAIAIGIIIGGTALAIALAGYRQMTRRQSV